MITGSAIEESCAFNKVWCQTLEVGLKTSVFPASFERTVTLTLGPAPSKCKGHLGSAIESLCEDLRKFVLETFGPRPQTIVFQGELNLL